MFKSKYFVYIYYAILLAIFMSWSDPSAVPNHIFMIAFMIAEFAPVFFIETEWLPMVLSVFMILAKVGVSNSYCPSDQTFYLVPVIAAIAINRQKTAQSGHTPVFLILLTLWVFLSDLIFGKQDSSALMASYVLYYLFLSILFQYKNISFNSIHLFSWVFIVASTLLSVQFLTLGSQLYMADYSDGFERIKLHDPNYFGSALAMGIMAAAIEIYSSKYKSWTRLLLYATIVLNTIVVFLNASRGSILSLGGALLVLVLFSKVKSVYKILTFAAIVAFLILIYESGFMDLLQYRIGKGTDSGDMSNHRFEIWSNKISAFFSEGNIFNYLFGFGNKGGKALGFSFEYGFHNDFIAYLVDYGFIGIILFILFITYPYRIANNNKLLILSATVFLALASCTIEPFTLGVYPNFAFWLYIVFLTQLDDVKAEYA